MADGTSGSEAVLGQLLDRFAAAWNRHDLDALLSMMTDDGVFEASAGPEVVGQRSEGRQAVRAAYAAVFQTFPDAHWANARHFVAGDRQELLPEESDGELICGRATNPMR